MLWMITPIFSSLSRLPVVCMYVLLPLKYTVATYYETAFEYVKTDIQSEADKLLDGINASAAGTLLQTKVFTRRLDGGCTEVRVYAVYESKISP